jgi:hypothetical protein
MRVTLIVVAIALSASPSHASKSCMTQAEARAAFGAVHLYWHGPNHCWDGTPGRHRLAQRSKTREQRRVAREAAEPEKPASGEFHSKWRNALSEMLPEDSPRTLPPATRSGSVTFDTPSPRLNWQERWVEVAQHVPPIVDRSEPAEISSAAREAEPFVTPARVLLALLAFVLMLGIVEILNRGTILGWRR